MRHRPGALRAANFGAATSRGSSYLFTNEAIPEPLGVSD